MTARDIDWAAVRDRLARLDTVDVAAVRDRRLLDERAAVLAAVPPTPPAGGTVDVVLVAVGAERYAVEARYVVEVRPAGEWTPLPGGPAHLLGLGNVRGDVLPVFDLAPVVGAAPADAAGGRVLVVGDGKPEFGLRVDRADEVRAVPAADILPPPAGGAGLVRGVTADAVAVLDGAATLRDPRFVLGGDADGSGSRDTP